MNTNVSLLGLGRMGEPIARRLLTELGSLTVWNRTPSKAVALGGAGAHVTESPAQAAAAITLTVMTDLADVEAILEGDDGLLAGWRANRVADPVLVVHGTVSPAGVAELGRRLRPRGVAVVDAPLSGGVAGAQSGNLSVMVGGEPEALNRALPILRMVGANVVMMGGPGSGEIAKACNQVVVAATVTAVAEALRLADANGIQRALLLDVLAGGLASSEVLRQKRARWLTDDYVGGGSANNQLKDLRFVAESASACGICLPLASELEMVFDDMVAAGFGDLDHSAVELVCAPHPLADGESGDG